MKNYTIPTGSHMLAAVLMFVGFLYDISVPPIYHAEVLLK